MCRLFTGEHALLPLCGVVFYCLPGVFDVYKHMHMPRKKWYETVNTAYRSRLAACLLATSAFACGALAGHDSCLHFSTSQVPPNATELQLRVGSYIRIIDARTRNSSLVMTPAVNDYTYYYNDLPRAGMEYLFLYLPSSRAWY